MPAAETQRLLEVWIVPGVQIDARVVGDEEAPASGGVPVPNAHQSGRQRAQQDEQGDPLRSPSRRHAPCRASLTRQMEQVKSYVHKQGVQCSAEIIKTAKGEDTPAQCILDYANKIDGDLIIIMTQQETNFTRMFIGSTAQEIVNNSEIPVMSIIPKMHKYKTAEQAAY